MHASTPRGECSGGVVVGRGRITLIVTCERCASQFQLDETKISPQGVRVRCSRCEHGFFVESPEQPDADHARDLVRETLGTAESDLSADVIADAPDGSSGLEHAAEPDDSMQLDAVEDDWEFNDDSGAITGPQPEVNALDDGLSAAREAVDDLLGGMPESSTPTQVDADSEPFGELDLDDDTDSRSGTESEVVASESESVEDVAPASITPLEEDDGPSDESSADSGIELRLDASPQTDSDDFDDPANWDIFDSETSGAVPASEVEPQLDSLAPESIAPIASVGVALPGAMGPNQTKSRMIEAAGCVVVALLVAACLLGGLSTPKLSSKPWQVESASAPGFELQGVSARWIDNAIAGRLYVISGKLRRTRGTTPWNVTPLAVQLLDAKGRRLDLPPTAIGPEIPDHSLRGTSPIDLADLQNGRAVHFAATADSWLSFAAVVPAMPADAERFEFSPLTQDAGS